MQIKTLYEPLEITKKHVYQKYLQYIGSRTNKLHFTWKNDALDQLINLPMQKNEIIQKVNKAAMESKCMQPIQLIVFITKDCFKRHIYLPKILKNSQEFANKNNHITTLILYHSK